nr:hypothetical protein [Serratia fonticola]
MAIRYLSLGDIVIDVTSSAIADIMKKERACDGKINVGMKSITINDAYSSSCKIATGP